MLSPAVEDYLKTIYEVEQEQGKVTNTALAARLAVAPASVTGMVKKLAQMALVTYAPYQGIQLTPEGKRGALGVIRHHRLIELFLAETLGMPWDEVHEEAHKIEHVLSERLEARMDDLLGFPETCPHGSPIPAADGSVIVRSQIPLSELPVGQPAVVSEIVDEDASLLRRAGALNLYPGAEVRVLKREPDANHMTIWISEQEEVVDNDAASKIWVSHPGITQEVKELP